MDKFINWFFGTQEKGEVSDCIYYARPLENAIISPGLHHASNKNSSTYCIRGGFDTWDNDIRPFVPGYRKCDYIDDLQTFYMLGGRH
jgi:hypothetical protein